MTRWLSLLVSVPFTLVVILFAVFNLHTVTVSTFPLPFEITLPLALLVLMVFAVGLVGGALLAWLYATPARMAARRDHARLAKMEKELALLHTSSHTANQSADSTISSQRTEEKAPAQQLLLPPI